MYVKIDCNNQRESNGEIMVRMQESKQSSILCNNLHWNWSSRTEVFLNLLNIRCPQSFQGLDFDGLTHPCKKCECCRDWLGTRSGSQSDTLEVSEPIYTHSHYTRPFTKVPACPLKHQGHPDIYQKGPHGTANSNFFILECIVLVSTSVWHFQPILFFKNSLEFKKYIINVV